MNRTAIVFAAVILLGAAMIAVVACQPAPTCSDRNTWRWEKDKFEGDAKLTGTTGLLWFQVKCKKDEQAVYDGDFTVSLMGDAPVLSISYVLGDADPKQIPFEYKGDLGPFIRPDTLEAREFLSLGTKVSVRVTTQRGTHADFDADLGCLPVLLAEERYCKAALRYLKSWARE